MLRIMTIALIVFTTSFAHAGFQEVVARCVVPGKTIDNSRVYSLHINESKTKGILIAIDTDKLTEAEYGDVKVSKGGRISMPSLLMQPSLKHAAMLAEKPASKGSSTTAILRNKKSRRY